MDNFYTSLSLARTLKIMHNANCADSETETKYVPVKVKNTKLKKKGKIITQHSGPICYEVK
jgi:hypothetical protein